MVDRYTYGYAQTTETRAAVERMNDLICIVTIKRIWIYNGKPLVPTSKVNDNVLQKKCTYKCPALLYER